MSETPAEAGFSMPTEWAPHSCCWMAWPCRENSFYDVEAGRDDFALVARSIARHEPVRMIANPRHVEDARRRCCGQSGGAPGDIEVVSMPTDDSWTRDTAPTFLLGRDGALGALEWRFSGWGSFRRDYAETARMAGTHRCADRCSALHGPDRARGRRVPQRRAGHAAHDRGGRAGPGPQSSSDDEADAEDVFREYLGVGKVIWLAAALEDDPTGGHVDDLACFVAPGVVVALSCDDPADPQYEPLRENLSATRGGRDGVGPPFAGSHD